MIIQFTLSMPNVGSWNGQWSGAKNLYARTRIVSKKSHGEAILAKRSYYYNFGDGWGASISVQKIDSAQARKVRKASKGFCGYEWMIDSIVSDLVIYGPTRPKPLPDVGALIASQEARDRMAAALIAGADLTSKELSVEEYKREIGCPF